jgi:hypothetical protein
MLGCLYLSLDYVTSTFSLHLDHQCSRVVCISLHQSIQSHISILSLSQHHHYRLNYFKIYFVDNKFEKIN